jgi:2-hydroxy-3-oxopropionate reductase
MEKIGFIGIGIMGNPMVKNLLKAGYAVSVYARREASIQALGSDQVDTYPSPAELAAHCNIIISCVADTPDVEEVLLGDNGVLVGINPQSLMIDMSTISPQVTRAIAAQFKDKNCSYLDAPVSGGDIGAIAGTLSIMVGGEEEAFQRALPIFQCLGKNIVHIGQSGAGQVAKACNQIVAAQTVTAVAEAFLLAESAGVSPAKVREALLGGFAYSKVLELHGQRILDQQYAPGFKAVLHAKDLAIALDTANNNAINLPGATLSAEYMNKLVAEGDGELDSSAMAKVILKQ